MTTHASGGRGPLPVGLNVRRRGESLETVASHALQVSLIAKGDGGEVLECALEAGQFITLLSSGSAFESYYLLAGQLRYESGGESLELGPGDGLSTEGLADPVILTALSPVRFLCFTSQPTFHEISHDLQDLMRLAEDIELKDGYTADHCRRIRQLSNWVAQKLELPPERLVLLNYAAYLHDLGKVRVPLAVLQKRGELSEAEWEEIKRHPAHGQEMLQATFMQGAGAIVAQHHERHDGSGYPGGLKGDEILLEAAIIAVVDSFDALTTDRVYHAAIDEKAALAEVKRLAGLLFKPEVVAAFEAVMAGEGGANRGV